MRSRRRSTSSLVALVAALGLTVGVSAQERSATAPNGESLYAQLCASCHGPQGRGDGAVADENVLRPRDFALNAFKFDTDADWQRGTDDDLANVIRHGPAFYGGSPIMPPWRSLSDEDITAIVAHIRVLQKKGGG